MAVVAKCEPGCSCGRHALNRERKHTIACLQCGNPFQAHRRTAQFCSATCRKVWTYQERREEIDARNREWAGRNPERIKAIKQRNADKNGAKYHANKRAKYDAIRADPELWAQQQETSRGNYAQNREKILRNMNLIKHGEGWEARRAELLAAQDGRCYLCGDPLGTSAHDVHIDHDHRCCPPRRTCEKCRRGLACRKCNSIVALAADDPERLRRIAANLDIALAAVTARLGA